MSCHCPVGLDGADVAPVVDVRDSRDVDGPLELALLAVSKTKPAADVCAAYEAGQQRFGENYLQDALPKISELDGCSIE